MSELAKYSYERFKGRHADETCLIVATGPGLKNIPVGFLSMYTSFSFNRITWMRDKGFVPTYFHCMGSNQLDTPEKRATMLPLVEEPKCQAMFINRIWAHYFHHPKVYSILSPGPYGHPEKAYNFSYSPFEEVGLGAPSVYLSLQFAVYMGFTTILIVGMDHDYQGKKHIYPDDEFPMFEDAPGPRYGNSSNQWRSEADKVLLKAKEACRELGVRVVNLSEPTACVLFERGDWREWV
jgi:hypothetical protein